MEMFAAFDFKPRALDVSQEQVLGQTWIFKSTKQSSEKKWETNGVCLGVVLVWFGFGFVFVLVFPEAGAHYCILKSSG